MKKIVLLSTFVFVKSIVFAQQLAISKINAPNLAGERMLTFDCPLDGNAPKDIKVFVIYSDNKEALLTGRDNPQGRATVRINSDDRSRLSCTFYFPHADHMDPNFITKDELNGDFNLSENDKREKYAAALLLKNSGQPYGEFTDKRQRSFYNPTKVYFKIARVGPNGEIRSSIHEFIMPRLFIIGYIGDSFTAGEGAPYSGHDKWDDNLCHRSNKSGGMRAINQLKQSHREVGIRVINTTCSGAKIGHLTFDPQHKSRANVPLYGNINNGQNSTKFSQLELIDNWCKKNDREVVDIILMGIGGNNIGFADMAKAAMNPIRDPRTWEQDALDAIEEAKNLLNTLPGKYDTLDSVMRNQDFEVSKILIMNYPNMFYGKNGKICDGFNNTPGWCLDPANFLFTHRVAFKDIHHKLNDEVGKAAQRNNWDVIRVSGINNHGMCNCEKPYFNTWSASIINQGDENGSVHPNSDGYKELYKENVYNALTSAVTEAQKMDREKKIAKARMDAKAELREKNQRQIDAEIVRKKLMEKYKREIEAKLKSEELLEKVKKATTTLPVKQENQKPAKVKDTDKDPKRGDDSKYKEDDSK